MVIGNFPGRCRFQSCQAVAAEPGKLRVPEQRCGVELHCSHDTLIVFGVQVGSLVIRDLCSVDRGGKPHLRVAEIPAGFLAQPVRELTRRIPIFGDCAVGGKVVRSIRSNWRRTIC